MKQKGVLAGFILVSVLYVFGGPCRNSLAEESAFNFDKTKSYDIYYRVDKSIQYLSGEKITGTVMVGGTAFLEVRSSMSMTDTPGYVASASIIAILPAGSPKPQTISEMHAH